MAGQQSDGGETPSDLDRSPYGVYVGADEAGQDGGSEAFAHAATAERDAVLPEDEQGLAPVDRLALFLVRLTGGTRTDLSRLWLNARRLSRFKAPLRQAVGAQETVTRDALTALIGAGEFESGAGEFKATGGVLRAGRAHSRRRRRHGGYSNAGTEDEGPLPDDLDLADLVIETAFPFCVSHTSHDAPSAGRESCNEHGFSSNCEPFLRDHDEAPGRGSRKAPYCTRLAIREIRAHWPISLERLDVGMFLGRWRTDSTNRSVSPRSTARNEQLN
ncbi:hypothetical protein ACQB60_23190 [Actinomycetota bacterium Odt1-20B]